MSRPFRFAFASLAVTLALGAASLSACAPTPEQRWDEMMAAQTPEGDAFRLFKKEFPQDYHAWRQQMLADYRSGLTDDEIGKRASELMRSFVIRDMEHTAKAPAAELMEVARANRDFIISLRRVSVDQCARFGMRGLNPGERTDGPSTQAALKAFKAQIVATAAGRARPVQRTEVGAADGEKLAVAMRRVGVDQRLLNVIGSGLQTASQADQCAGSVALYEGIAALPPEDAARWTASVLRDSARQAAGQPGA